MLSAKEGSGAVPARRHQAFIALPSLGLCYARVPKAANSSIKEALHHVLAGEPVPDAAWNDYPFVANVNKDKFWRDHASGEVRMVDATGYRRRFGQLLCFTFVRNPFARTVSCYYDKVVLRERVGGPLQKLGFHGGMSFGDFVRHLCSVDDADADVHFRSQVALLSDAKGLAPAFVGRVESLQQDWAALQAILQQRGGPLLGALRNHISKTSGRRPPVAAVYDRRTEEAILRRYASDFDAFYPESRSAGLDGFPEERR